MRTQKRDPSQRAFFKGYQVGFQGHPDNKCPHNDNTEQGHEWMNGWQEGHGDYLRGYSIATAQERIASL
ncbi:MAG: ribosome modulation factor [Porticoccaceae bacterium]|nr:ribosome modulation factor [Porticoccaceae bacterium]